MKNIFKVMGVALLACSMIMVSCKKDDDKDGGSSIADGINVNFDGESWTASSNQSRYMSAYGAIEFYGVKTQGELPIFDEAFSHTEVGTFSSTADANNMAALDGDHNWVEYYEATYLQDGSGNYYGDWWAKQATTEIAAIDLTALTISAKMNGTMFSAVEAYTEAGGAVGMDGASTASYSVTAGNIHLNSAK